MQLFNQNETIVVLDFETSGMYPEQGDRAIEVGAVLLRDRKVVDRFQSLINPGFMVTREIESITGITNTMLVEAPIAEDVMGKFVEFIDSYPLVAHNASFDQKFLEAELNQIGKVRPLNFGCTLQLARRIYPDVLNHKLETLVRYKGLSVNGQFHRALADAEMAAALWVKIVDDLKTLYGFDEISFDLMKKISKHKKEQIKDYLQKTAEESRLNQLDTTGNLFG